MKIVLLGAPNSGKGTISAMLSEHYKVPHLSTGNMFRQLAEEGSKLGLEAKEKYLEKGKLVPDDVTIKLVKEMLDKPEYRVGFIMEGFPRTIDQAKALDKILGPTYLMIKLDVNEETLVDRASGRRMCKRCKAIYHIRNVPPKKEGICDKCGGELYQREDSKPEIFRERLRVYNEETKPVLSYYGARVVKVNGEGTPQPIFERVVNAIKKSSR
ncbi:nucleoside monophosphate kinase [Candidatus Woesearchaeota archaeon]|nr:nucleoside monophosphate kinase [Candidatus Woesearchaeota archaeon]